MVQIEPDSCRICLSITQTNERQDLFFEEGLLSAVGSLYEEVLNIPVKNNVIIRYICNYCDLQLKLFRELRNKALEAYSFLTDVCEPLHDALLKTFTSIESDVCKDIEAIDADVSTPIEEDPDHADIIPNEEDAYVDISDDEPYDVVFLDEENELENVNDEVTGEENEHEVVNEEDEMRNEETMGSNEDEIKYEEGKMRSKEDEMRNEETMGSNEDEIKYEEGKMRSKEDEIRDEEYEFEAVKDATAEDEMEEYLIESNGTRTEYPNPAKHEFRDVYPCDLCNQTFSLKSQLRNHRNKQHPKSTKFSCSLCSKVMFSEEAVQAHLNIHNGLPAYSCDMCEKSFNQKVHYNYHMLNHNNERNIICDVCQKGFLSKGDLKTHMRVHTDERRYKCDICGKTFRAHTHMVNHRYSHFEKQFECPECLQKYVSPNTLRSHFKSVHNGEVPFECKFCEKKFKRKHHLHAHYKTHAKRMVILDKTDSNDLIIS